MDEVATVRHLVRRQGMSIRSVAKQLGISRNSVKRYLRDDVVAGERKAAKRASPQREAIRRRVEEILEASPAWTGGKQRLTGQRLHEMLRAEGIVVGRTTLYEHLRERGRRQREVFIPLVYEPGDLAEVDFFEVLVDLRGTRTKAWMFVMRLMHSGRDFAWLYERQDQVSFLDGHVRAFEHFGGVIARVLLDNLRAAVAKMLAGCERVLTARYAALAAHYSFEPCFARPATGHDKGGVESRGRAIRWTHLVPIPSGESLESINQALLKSIDARTDRHRAGEKQTITELFEAERTRLLPLPVHAFDPAAVKLVTVGPRSLVSESGAYYSVWTEWAGLTVQLYVRPGEVEIAHDGRSVRHPRIRFGERSIDYRHYVRELARKPQAIRQVSAPLLRDLGAPFDRAWEKLVSESGPKQAARAFAKILEAIVNFGMEEARRRLAAALAAKEPIALAFRPVVLTEAVPSLPTSLSAIEIESARACDFDFMLGVAR